MKNDETIQLVIASVLLTVGFLISLLIVIKVIDSSVEFSSILSTIAFIISSTGFILGVYAIHKLIIIRQIRKKIYEPRMKEEQ